MSTCHEQQHRPFTVLKFVDFNTVYQKTKKKYRLVEIAYYF